MASDYVQTNTDLASMEGANEAARRAVNSILQDSDSSELPCRIWKLREPDVLAVLRWADKEKFKKGQPWDGQLSFLSAIIIKIKMFIKMMVS